VKGVKIRPGMYEHSARVQFTGAFPIDMLRHDACHPVSETESHVIERSLRDHGGGTVTVRCVTERANSSWAVGRWRSFSATLTEVDGRG
jgi:hypothetical protein